MKAVIERLEYSWWNFHIRVLDESRWVREALPEIRAVWVRRDEALTYLAWSLLGFPLGLALGLLSAIAR